jgi:hypothetical protein
MAMDPEPKTYQLSPEAAEKLAWKQVVSGLLASTLAMAVFVLVVVEFADSDQRVGLVFVAGATLAAVFTMLVIRSGRFQKDWESYLLQLDENGVLRSRNGTEPMRILRNQITSVWEVKGRGLTLRSSDRGRQLFIPAGLAGYEEVRGIISQWKTPRTLTLQMRASRQAPVLALGLLYFASWIICDRSEDPAKVVPSTLVFYTLTAVGAWKSFSNPNLPTKHKVVTLLVFLISLKVFAKPLVKSFALLGKAWPG